jgi:hypothetical protein
VSWSPCQMTSTIVLHTWRNWPVVMWLTSWQRPLPCPYPPLTAPPASVRAVSEMSDKEVLALTALQMASERDRRLSTLLHKQQAGDLSEPERSELLALMQCYQEGLLRKAHSLHEAVRRGLRAPLEP